MKRLKLPLLIVALLLNGCYDRTEDVVLTHADGSPVRCPHNQETRYEFVAPVLVDNEVAYVHRYEKVINEPGEQITGQLLLGYLRGGRTPWVQFFVFCGESKILFYKTEKLTQKDLIEREGNGYIYFVDGKMQK